MGLTEPTAKETRRKARTMAVKANHLGGRAVEGETLTPTVPDPMVTLIPAPLRDS